MATTPFVVLSYVGGPALLTNATSLFILSTSNRFARAVDRARVLAEQAPREDTAVALADAHHRVKLIVRALTSFYIAGAMFALVTLGAIVGAAVSEIQDAPMLNVVSVGAATVGIAGFIAFVTGAIALVFEARLTAHALAREADIAMGRVRSAIDRLPRT